MDSMAREFNIKVDPYVFLPWRRNRLANGGVTMAGINEKTIVRLSISSWIHVIVILVTMVSTVVWLYSRISTDVAAAIQQSAENAKGLADSNRTILQMQMELKFFHEQYEKDMQRYIRDTPSR